ncbi:MAG: hypothetical protein M3391_01900 [Actinomycetota bacterium]|nr:hypothetical protein [Actinomycetota bacterium]
MIMGRFSTRKVLFGCVVGLVSAITGGGAVLGLAEGAGVLEGMWLAFNVVTTTGFGAGPATGAGQLLSAALFFVAACCWFGILVVAIEVGNMRFQKYSLIDEALRPLERRPRNRLFHTN